jgi:hypothetical protein
MEEQPKCLYCQQTSDSVPLINLTYQGKPLWICSQHLPILIHEQHKLIQQLDDAAKQAGTD